MLTHGILRKIEVESSSTQCVNAVEMDSSTTNSWSLWCSLFVVLLRTIASQDDLIDQGRIANRSVLEYADVLFCHGHHQSAVTSYSRAISGLMEISSDNEIQTEKPWEDVKRATLLKCLYCFVAEGNRVGHIIAAISLRNTQLQSSDFVSKNNIKKIGHSHSSDSRNSLSGHVSPSSNHSPWDDKQRTVFFADRFSTSNTDNLVDNVITSRVLPFKLYFEVKDVAVVYDVKNQLVLENSSPQGRIELSAGGTYKLKIQLLSLFPCTVQVDAVSVLYLHQQPAHSAPGSFSNPSSITSSPHHLSPESYSNFNFNFTALCTTSESEHSDEVEGNMNLILIPGEMKSICLMITAPADRGNYSANEIRISVKNREESIVFLGEESDHKLSLRKEHATSFIMTSCPSFSVKKKPILSSIEENSVLHGGLVHAADAGVGNNMSGVCAFSTGVHLPLLLPVRDGPAGTGTGMETGVFERALKGSNFSQNIVNREFIIQVEITNNSQSTASITAVQLRNPSGLPTIIALTQDRHKLDEKQMELFLIGNPISPVLPDLIPLGMQPRENSNQISLMSGESYCLAFKFILKEISIGPLDKRVIIGDTTLAAIELDEAVVGSSENVLKSNSGGPDLIFTFEFSGIKGHQSDFEVSLSSSLLYLSEAVEKSQTGSNCKYSLSDKSGSEASSSITAVNASSAESDTGSNYYGQEVVRASQIEVESQGEEKMEEEEFTIGGIG